MPQPTPLYAGYDPVRAANELERQRVETEKAEKRARLVQIMSQQSRGTPGMAGGFPSLTGPGGGGFGDSLIGQSKGFGSLMNAAMPGTTTGIGGGTFASSIPGEASVGTLGAGTGVAASGGAAGGSLFGPQAAGAGSGALGGAGLGALALAFPWLVKKSGLFNWLGNKIGGGHMSHGSSGLIQGAGDRLR